VSPRDIHLFDLLARKNNAEDKRSEALTWDRYGTDLYEACPLPQGSRQLEE
jgi:hypothetical protein